MNYSDTKWKQEKVESIMEANGVNFESNENGYYSNSYFKFYGNKRRIIILTYKTTISIDCGNRYWNGITSYKELNEAIKHFSNIAKQDV